MIQVIIDTYVRLGLWILHIFLDYLLSSRESLGGGMKKTSSRATSGPWVVVWRPFDYTIIFKKPRK